MTMAFKVLAHFPRYLIRSRRTLPGFIHLFIFLEVWVLKLFENICLDACPEPPRFDKLDKIVLLQSVTNCCIGKPLKQNSKDQTP